MGFAVLFLHDERGLSEGAAALVVAVAQALAAGFRIGAGRWSDIVGSRIVPLRYVGLAVAAGLGVTAALAAGPLGILVAVLALAGGLSMGWNGLSFAAAAELAGARRSGPSIGFQQTGLSAIGIGAPVLFAGTVSATSWGLAFLLAALLPLVGWRMLRPFASTRRVSKTPPRTGADGRVPAIAARASFGGDTNGAGIEAGRRCL